MRNIDTYILNLDEAMDCYEATKRVVSKKAYYYFDKSNYTFKKANFSSSDNVIEFICAFSVCKSIIDKFLELPQFSQYKSAYKEKSKNSKNCIVEFLWFFEHIDGCYNFNKFENKEVLKIIKKWCILNDIQYKEATIYADYE